MGSILLQFVTKTVQCSFFFTVTTTVQFVIVRSVRFESPCMLARPIHPFTVPGGYFEQNKQMPNASKMVNCLEPPAYRLPGVHTGSARHKPP